MRLISLIVLLWAVVAQAQPVDVLLIGADDALLAPILGHLEQAHQETTAAWTLWTGRLGGRTVVLVRSEGDPLNAVAATTLAVRRHPPRLIVTFGIAGALDSAFQTGDLVVSREFAAFDGIFSPRRESGEGAAPKDWQKLPHLFLEPDGREKVVWAFPADTAAMGVALTLQNPRGRVVSGTLGSAYQLNREKDRVSWLRENWHAGTADTESAHIAGCAMALGVPVVGLRIIDGSPEDAAKIAERFVEAWR